VRVVVEALENAGAPDAEAMFARVERVLRRLPIGQNARVVVRHGKKELNPREVRIPKH
jgi:hypothetical protein